MFVAEFENCQDRDRMRDGSPWHVSGHAVILAEFEDCMKSSKLKFDKLQLWARVLNLPFNLQYETWGKAIAKKIDKDVTYVQFVLVGGFLRARVTIDVNKPLGRWILIDSAKRKSRDWYDIQYEQVPNFCFSCGRLGHADLARKNDGVIGNAGVEDGEAKITEPDPKKKKPTPPSFDNSAAAAVDSSGLRGGIGLFWSKDVVVDLRSCSFGHIDDVVRKADLSTP
ncbi:hypothetical protein D1007_07499 [Hordeum vulgare]|nr:hypothetical protein D1007_07499 [Hordeum vulgare]